MIQSSRFNNQPAWFVGQSDQGDYYDHDTGTYLGSWSRSRGNFVNESKINSNISEIQAESESPQIIAQPATGELLSSLVQPVLTKVSRKPPGPDPLRLPGKYVAFVGDSFCAHVDKARFAQWSKFGYDMRFRSKTDGVSWTGLVADSLGCNLAPYGFGGRSWWYSWQKFWHDWHHRLDELEAVIFTHTWADRINNSVDNDLPHLTYKDSFDDKEKIQALKYYITYIKDHQFQRWCQQQYFRHIREVMPDVPQMHFFAFNLPTPETCEILPGMKFTTPLVLLSAAETRIKDPKTFQLPTLDERVNHFNEHNNRAMADLVLAAVQDYRPGAYPIPHLDFYQKNPNDFIQALDYSVDKDLGRWI